MTPSDSSPVISHYAAQIGALGEAVACPARKYYCIHIREKSTKFSFWDAYI